MLTKMTQSPTGCAMLFAAIFCGMALAALCGYAAGDRPIPQCPASPPMPQAQAEAHAAELTGWLSDCIGQPGAWQCRPAGLSQRENPYLHIGPVTVCIDGKACRLIGPPLPRDQ